MTSPRNAHNHYSKCPPRVSVEFTVDDALAKAIAANSTVIPLFEKGLFEHAYKRHYSLLRNENLKCTWAAYKKHSESRVIAPFQFPDQRDLHFYKGTIRFIPSETEFKRPSFRKTLKPGPGVDYGGQMPIPQELLMKRNYAPKEKAGKDLKRKHAKSGKGKKTTDLKKEGDLEKKSKSKENVTN